MARETARTGVTANIVCPGPTDTEMLRDVAAAHPDAEKVLERLATAESRTLLRKLAEGAAGARLTRESRSAEDRLSRLHKHE